MFSPWYKLARRTSPAAPENHVALNVALYGRTRRWCMTERGSKSLRRDQDNLQIGPSALHWNGTTLTVDINEITAPLPMRVRGTLRLHPAGLATREILLDGIGKHRWSPIAPGARVEVALEHPALSWQGTAYFDTNSGDEALESGFIGWDWCRAPVQDGMAVLYPAQRRNGEAFCTALHYDKTGRAAEFDAPPPAALPRSFWRIPRLTRSEPSVTARVEKTLEDTPFYARSIVASQLLGQNVLAVHESLSLDRFNAPWVQLMLPFKAPRAWSVLF